MNKRINFIFGLHNHQPVGNLSHVFEEAFEKSYKPFVTELQQHPDIKVTLHFTGILLEWFLKERPEFLHLIRDMVSRGQVEIMGGGFYEPILPVIPDEDKLGQIKKMSDFVRLHFGTEVKGIWLAERIWEPQLAKPIAEAGIEYIVVDDAHFKGVGFSDEDCTGYYITEEQGRELKIFPISEKLRYLIPFKSPEKTIDFLKEMATEEGDRVLVLADDGEKFGCWPETYKSVYEDGWLNRFFELLEENSSWLETMTFSQYIDSFPAKNIIYLPNGSYREMMEWSGGFWRNFMVKYPESNRMHKRMLATREKVYRITDPLLRNQAIDQLWAGQCNCAYWHGVFGGLYLNFLRSAVYSSLIKAQVLAEEQLYPEEHWAEVEERDFLYDGINEMVVNTKELGIYISPAKGGGMYGLDYKPSAFNLMDTLSRQRESYHDRIFDLIGNTNECMAAGEAVDIENTGDGGGGGTKTIHEIVKVKEEGLDKYLIYDEYQRISLQDHFFYPGETLENFKELKHVEIGDFIMSPYKAEVSKDNKIINITLSREGSVEQEDTKKPVSLEKVITVDPQDLGMEINYKLKNRGKHPIHTRFGIEFNYSFLAGYADDRYYYGDQGDIEESNLASTGDLEGLEKIGIKDHWLNIDLSLNFSRPAGVWRLPIETVSQSEDGIERVYQSSVVIPYWELELMPGEEWDLQIKKDIKSV